MSPVGTSTLSPGRSAILPSSGRTSSFLLSIPYTATGTVGLTYACTSKQAEPCVAIWGNVASS